MQQQTGARWQRQECCTPRGCMERSRPLRPSNQTVLAVAMSRGGYFRVALVCVDGAVRMTEGEGSKAKVARFCAFV
jgi:hypothetical protein